MIWRSGVVARLSQAVCDWGFNDVTVPDRYPINHMGNLPSTSGENPYFTSLDLINGFLPVPLHCNSCPLTAFSREKVHHEFVRMVFGLKLFPLTFTCLINDMFRGMLSDVLHTYIDDLCPSHTEERSICNLKIVQVVSDHGCFQAVITQVRVWWLTNGHPVFVQWVNKWQPQPNPLRS